MPKHNSKSSRHPLQFVLLILLLLCPISCVPSDRNAQYTDTQARQEKQQSKETFQARVVKILDGDTIEIIDSRNSTTRIRLQAIDAPEKTQAFGNRARQRLSELIFNRIVTLETSGRDIYGRTISKVLFYNKDVCLQLIQEGFAWHFKRYADSQSKSDRESYSQAEETSRQQKLGLWADEHPVPPWQYRK